MGDTLELVILISSSLASEIKCHVSGGCFLSHERGHVGLKMGFSQGGDVVCKAGILKSGYTSEPPQSFKKFQCPQYTGPVKSEFLGKDPDISIFLSFQLIPMCNQVWEYGVLSQRVRGLASALGFLKAFVMAAITTIVTLNKFPCIIIMGRRKRNCLCLNRKEQCYYGTTGKSSWHSVSD